MSIPDTRSKDKQEEDSNRTLGSWQPQTMQLRAAQAHLRHLRRQMTSSKQDQVGKARSSGSSVQPIQLSRISQAGSISNSMPSLERQSSLASENDPRALGAEVLRRTISWSHKPGSRLEGSGCTFRRQTTSGLDLQLSNSIRRQTTSGLDLQLSNSIKRLTTRDSWTYRLDGFDTGLDSGSLHASSLLETDDFCMQQHNEDGVMIANLATAVLHFEGMVTQLQKEKKQLQERSNQLQMLLIQQQEEHVAQQMEIKALKVDVATLRQQLGHATCRIKQLSSYEQAPLSPRKPSTPTRFSQPPPTTTSIADFCSEKPDASNIVSRCSSGSTATDETASASLGFVITKKECKQKAKSVIGLSGTQPGTPAPLQLQIRTYARSSVSQLESKPSSPFSINKLRASVPELECTDKFDSHALDSLNSSIDPTHPCVSIIVGPCKKQNKGPRAKPRWRF